MAGEKPNGQAEAGDLRPLSANEIFDRFTALRDRSGPVPQHDAAALIGVSEGALVQAKAAYGEATALAIELDDGFRALLAELSRAGTLMFQARNPHCVAEIHGEMFATAPRDGAGHNQFAIAGAETAGEVDLETARLGSAYFLVEDPPSGRRPSLQFFDKSGVALLKIDRTNASHAGRFDRIADLFDRNAPARGVAETRTAQPTVQSAAPPLDAATLEARWLDSMDRSDIEALLSGSRAARPAAYRALDGALASRVDRDAAHRLLVGAAATQTVISARVGNAGCTQTFSGRVETIQRAGQWLTVRDRGFHLHIHETEIAEAWVVRAPTQDSVLSWLDCLDADGASLVQFYGRRPDGRSLCTQGPGCWRALLGEFVFQDTAQSLEREAFC